MAFSDSRKGDLETDFKDLGRCGHNCCRLCTYHTGELVNTAQRLCTQVESYKSLRLVAEAAKACDFDAFTNGLVWLASQKQPCRGCRLGGGWSWWRDCPVRICTSARRVDFCYQCEQFPCQTLKKGPLKGYLKRFVATNRQMKRQGVDEWIRTRYGQKDE